MQKLIETLKQFGIEVPEDKQAEVRKALSKHYKNAAEHEKAVSKLEGERDTWKEKAETAESTLQKFEGIDPEQIQTEINNWKQKAETAENNAKAQIRQRDQRDFLKAEFDRLGITSERTRRSLMADIMGDDGLKWKDGKFMGLRYMRTSVQILLCEYGCSTCERKYEKTRSILSVFAGRFYAGRCHT